jgi:pimeloyl-ACP methyl ester carboxylesterase
MRRWVPFVLLLALLLSIAYALAPAGRLATESLEIVADLWDLGGTAGTEPISGAIELRYDGPGGEGRIADLYCGASPAPGARLLLVHGLVEDGKDDARLRALGRAFGRHRFLVMVPDLPGMRGLRVGAGDIEEVRAALAALGRIDACPAGISGEAVPAPALAAGAAATAALPTGVVGISYSSGPALLALDGPGRLADFAVLFGGYYDLEDVILFLTTGRYRDGGADRDGEVLPEGRWILLGANAQALASPADRAALEAISRRRRARPEADISDLTATLGPEARAALDLLANTDPARFAALAARLDPSLRRALAALSPSRSLSGPLDVDLYLMHGRSDAIVPYTQSLRLEEGVRTRGTVRLAILGGFRHARPDHPAADAGLPAVLRYPADSWRLLSILEEILARRRGGPLTGGGPDRR